LTRSDCLLAANFCFAVTLAVRAFESRQAFFSCFELPARNRSTSC